MEAAGRGEARHLVDCLRWRASVSPDRAAYLYQSQDGRETQLTWGDLERRVRVVAARLQESETPGSRVLLLFPAGLEFVVAFFACLFAGAVAVPVAPPPRRSQLGARIRSFLADTRAASILTTPARARRLRAELSNLPRVHELRLTAFGDGRGAGGWRPPAVGPDTPALIQYTSGSTATPKGVVLHHGHLLHNLRLIGEVFAVEEGSTGVTWLPHYHDMGLIGNLLFALYAGLRGVLLAPGTFTFDPIRWLEAISRHRAVASGGPNFAYEHCLRRITPEQKHRLDLSCWSVAFNGSEPIRSATLDRFAAAFASCGFRKEAFVACYGLAESTLLVAGGRGAGGPRRFHLDAAELGRHVAVSSGNGGARRTLIGCGRPPDGVRVEIVDPETRRRCRPGRVGEVWVAGASVADGYWKRETETEATFRAFLLGGGGPFLRTGDLGCLIGGELVVTGRLKDLILIRGRNHYPQDVEHTAGTCHPALRAEAGAAFTIDADDGERLVVVQELVRGGARYVPDEVCAALRQAVAEVHGLQVHTVVLVRAGALARTSSGKVRRRLCRQRFLTGSFDEVAREALGTVPAAAADAIRERFTAMPPAARRRALSGLLRRGLAAALQVPAERIGPDRALSTLGIDSVGSLEVAHLIESELGLQLSAGDLNGEVTVNELAERILARPGGPAAEAAPGPSGPADPPARDGSLPLAPGQSSIWFHHRTAPLSAAYNVGFAARVEGGLEPRALESALRLLIERHGALRTSFSEVAGEPRQSPCRHPRFDLDESDAAGLGREALAAAVAAEIHRPFDLARGPLLRARLFHRDGRRPLLVLTAHHIAVDLWSLMVLAGELRLLYPLVRSGDEEPRLEPAPELAEHVLWQRRMLRGPEGGRLFRFWKRELASLPPDLDLSTDRPRPALQTFGGAAAGLALGRRTGERLRAFAGTCRATAFHVLLSTFALLLARRSGQDLLAVGTVAAGRTQARTRDLVGYLANPLALVVDSRRAPGFGELVERVRDRVLRALEHQDLPFPLLVAELGAERDPGRSPIFQALFLVERPPQVDAAAPFLLGRGDARLDLGGLVLSPYRTQTVGTLFDLTLTLVPVAGEYHGALEYNPDLFDATTVRRLARQYVTLLTEGLDAPTRRASELALLGGAARHQLEVEWAGLPAAEAAPSWDGLFASRAGLVPDSVAVVDGHGRISYGELDSRSNQLARELRTLGVGPEARVGLAVERGAGMVTALAAVAKAGGASVPVDPTYPGERIAFMVEDAGLAVLLTERGPDKGPRGLARAFKVVELAASGRGAAASRLGRAAPQNAAYVLYTSGSTGRPKGVVVSRRSLGWYAATCAAHYRLAPGDRLPQLSAISFDIGIGEVFPTLAAGATLVYGVDVLASGPADFLESCRRHEVTVLLPPTAFWHELAAEVAATPSSLPAALRLVSFGGEAVHPGRVADWQRAVGRRVRLVNGYGPTEATVEASLYELGEEASRSGAADAPELARRIGRAVAGARLFVADSALRPVAPKAAGELCLAGPGLARGYLSRPAATASSFVPNPHGGSPGERLYRTGDRVRFLADGTLEVLGRLDDQVKLRGFRIEPGEVEAALAAHPDLRSAAVVPREDVPGSERPADGHRRLVAYVTARRGAAHAPDGAELRDGLRRRLPGYMVPLAVVVLEGLPRTPAGKVDRRALAAMPPPARECPPEGQPRLPGSPLEERMTRIWARVLGVEQVGAQDNFFELGGDSILSLRVVAECRRAGLRFTPRDLFLHQTVAELAPRVSESAWDDDREAAASELPVHGGSADLGVGVQDVYPLTPVQQGLLFHTLYDADSQVYFEQVGLTLSGDLDVAAFRRSWQGLVDRHAVLRTDFRWDGAAVPLQVVRRHAELPWHEEDWSGEELSDRVLSERLAAFAETDRRRGFELTRAPLMRMSLVRTGAESHRFIWSSHHLLLDGWSTSLLLAELLDAYRAWRRGHPPAQRESRPFRDYVAWLAGRDRGSAERYWRRALAGFAEPTLAVPERERPESAARELAEAELRLSESLTADLEACGRRRRATLGTLIQGAWALLLGRYTGRRDVVFGVTVAGRPAELAGSEEIVGPMMSSLPLRVALGDEPVKAWLARVQERGAALRQHETSSLVDVRKWSEVAPERPLFDNVVIFENYPLAGPLVRCRELFETRDVTLFSRTNYPLALTVMPGRRLGLQLSLAAADGAATAKRMLRHVRGLLAALVDAADELPADALAWPGAAERHQLLVEWSRRQGSQRPASGATFRGRFAARAKGAPHAVAVTDPGRCLTCGELDRRSDTLARRLRELGVVPEVRVGVLAERSAELAVALLGIVKAGGAYLPLDPSYPAARLAFMLADAGVRVLVTGRADVPAEVAAGLPRVDPDARLHRPGTPPAPLSSPLHAAYVIYTSGSTGRPKGVVIPRGALDGYVAAAIDHYGLGPHDRLAPTSSISFDISVMELFPALACGATLVFVADVLAGSIGDFLYRCRDASITVLFPPTVLWHELATELARDPAALPPALRLVDFGGERVLASRIADWRRAVGARVRLINGYGPTETTVEATFSELAPPPRAGGEASVGRPLAGAAAYVADPRLRPAPMGAAGELCIAGQGLARGYLGRAAATAVAFVPDPFGSEPGGRLYRSGDRTRFLPAGDLEVLGRLDRQLKVRGYRIEPAEIEDTLAAHPAVAGAAVLAVSENGRPGRLVAYVASRSAAGDDLATDLAAHLRRRMPAFMVPESFVLLDELPRTPSGKVDRRALPKPPEELPEALPKPASSAQEATLKRIWEEVLERERVARQDDFFALGGDSILAMRIVARGRQEGLRFTPRDLFRHPTVAALAAVAVPERVAEPSGEVVGPVPLTPVQRAFFEGDPSEPWHYNQALLLKVQRPLTASRLAKALARLLRHHDALRLRFAPRDGSWHQESVPFDGLVPLIRIDLSRLGAGPGARALQPALTRLQASLDLARGPLTRAAYVDNGPRRGHRFFWTVHHLAVDAVSWPILVADLESGYRQLERGSQVTLPPKTTSFRSWAEKLAREARSASLGREIETWTRAARHPAALPRDFDGGANLLAEVRTVEVGLDRERTRQLLRLVPAAYRTRADEVLLAALAAAFRRWTGRSSLLLELESHGRQDLFDDVDLSRTVGWFTATYPVALELPRGGSTAATLTAVKEQLRQVPRGGLGYGLLRYLRGGAETEGLRRLPQPEVIFNYLGRFDAAGAGAELFTWNGELAPASHSRRGARSHLLEIDGGVHRGRLRMAFAFCRLLHRRSTVERLARTFREELEALIDDGLSSAAGEATPSDFPLADLDEASFDLLPDRGRDLEDVYPLTPVQEGMLFHTLYEPGSPVYVEQISWTMRGELDPAAFRRAWRTLVDRHAALRTSFLWKGLDRPLQLVHRHLELPWEEEDLKDEGLSEAACRGRFEALTEADRGGGFDLARAPLMRLWLARIGPRSFRFLWTSHHLLLDGWSAAHLLGELLACYEAFRRDRPPELAPARPFRDYVAWLAGRDRAADERFWRRELAGFRDPTPVAGPRPRPTETRPGLVVSARRLSAAATRALKGLAERRGLTLGTMIQGAWAVLLARYGRRRDVLFGTTVAGRPPDLTGSEEIVGPLIDTLPVRIRVSRTPLPAWLRRLQHKNVELRQHGGSSLALARHAAGVPADSALFHSLVVFENYPVAGALERYRESFEVSDLALFSHTNYELLLTAEPRSRLALQVSARAASFDRVEAERLVRHLRTLLDGMLAASEDASPDELSLLGPAERHQLVVEWNDTRRLGGAGRDGTVVGAFRRRAAAVPDAVAVVGGRRHLSYAELDRRSARLARRLSRRTRRGDLVGLFVERSPEMVTGILGALRAGAAYVPLDPAYPRERLANMIAETRSPVILTQEALRGGLAGAGGEVVCLEADHRGPVAQVEEPEPDDLAYVIYTSGSSGRPKGIALSHRALWNLVAWHLDGSPAGGRLRRPGRVLQLASPSFDASFHEIFAALCAGGSVVLAPEPLRLDAAALSGFLAAMAVDKAIVPVVTLQRLAEEALEQGEPGPGELIATGEELLVTPAVRRFFQRFPGVSLHNHYGPSETHVVTAHTLPPEPSRWPARPPIGRPISRTAIYLVDERLRPAVLGREGELVVGGDPPARGYLRRPRRTAESFVPDPFSTEPGGRLYRTGDLACHLDDGEILYLGRADLQVKVRGHRVEPGEVEAALARHPAVRRAAVLASSRGEAGSTADVRLVAFVVPERRPGTEDPAAVGAAELRAFLSERLPDYMVPATFTRLAALPFTPTGKIDRSALADLLAASPARRVPRAAPRNPVEDLLARLWSEILDDGPIGVHDNFFELGGHSLTATRILSRIHRAFGVDLAVRSLFEGPTVAELARKVENALRSGEARAEPVPLRRATRRDRLPLSFAQQRLWFLHQLLPESTAYNLTDLCLLAGRLDGRALELALRELVRRHEVLRTIFPSVDGEPRQAIAPRPDRDLLTVDLTRLPGAASRLREARRTARREASRPFDLERGPLLRTALLALGDERHALLLALHHTIADGGLREVFHRELGTLYDAFQRGEASPLPELGVQYADFALWQRERLKPAVRGHHLAFWRRELAGLRALELPADRPPPAVRSSAGAAETVSVGAEVVAALEEVSRRAGATLFMALLGALLYWLRRLTGQTDLAVGSPVSHRNREELEGLIGLFVNTLVLRLDLAGDPSFPSLVERLRDRALEAAGHQELPFEKLVEELQPGRDLRNHPLFQVLFSYHGAAIPGLSLTGLDSRTVDLGLRSVQFDLELHVWPSGEGLDLVLAYSTALFDRTTAGRWKRQLLLLLKELAIRPDRRLSELDPIGRAERHQMLVEWNDSRTELAGPPLLHRGFEIQAGRTPDAVAVAVDGSREEQLSFGELERRAVDLTRALAAAGVGPGSRVGLFLERGAQLIVGVLATLKAGSAWIPMDPAYPGERTRLVLEDCGARLVLTETRLLPFLPPLHPPVLCLDAGQRESVTEAEPAVFEVAESHPAYLIYTSGSGGRPKGVVISHRAITNHMLWLREALPLTPADRVLQKTPLGFDASVWEVWAPLTTGGRLVLARPDGHRDAAYLVEAVRRHRVSLLQAVPSLLAVLLDESGFADCGSLEGVLCGGETLTTALRDAFFHQGPRARLYNFYGPTETTINASVAAWRGPDRQAASLGRPLSNLRLYVLDALLQPVPLGAPGELFIGGAGLAQGYLAQPAKTANCFLPDPFASLEWEPGRLYRSADRARHLADGRVDFLGRADRQVKIRGHRIELGEVEAVLCGHPAVRRGAVVFTGGRLAAFVVVDASSAPGSFRKFLNARLPLPAVPETFVPLDTLPLLPNGKVDLHALQEKIEAGETALEPAARYVAPRNPVEELLAEIWSAVLERPRIGVHDDFFELGGHSLLATRIVSRVRQVFRVPVPLVELFHTPTLAALAESLKAHEPIPGQVEKVAKTWVRLRTLAPEERARMLRERRSRERPSRPEELADSEIG